jgi:serine/threonine protein kinase HipA of HipAB toxin-antitoxin module
MKLIITTLVLSIAAALALVSAAHAVDSTAELDPRQRAKIAKAKAKAANQEAENFNFLSNGNGQEKPACGSQSIGNVELNRQAGVGPREIFIFAPDAINIVGPRGCQ